MRRASKALVKARKSSGTLGFAFLVYRRASTVWTARSVMTGHIAHGSSEHEAVEALQRVIDVSIFFASQHGQSPSDWLNEQRPDFNKYLVEFCGLVAEGTKEKTKTSVGKSGCVLEMRIRKRVA